MIVVYAGPLWSLRVRQMLLSQSRDPTVKQHEMIKHKYLPGEYD